MQETPVNSRSGLLLRQFANLTSAGGGEETYQCQGCLLSGQKTWFYSHFSSCQQGQALLEAAEALFTPYSSSLKRRRLENSLTGSPPESPAALELGIAPGAAGVGSSGELPDLPLPVEAYRIITDEETGEQEAIASDASESEGDLERYLSDTVSKCCLLQC